MRQLSQPYNLTLAEAMNSYKKTIVAALGFLALLIKNFWRIDIDEAVIDNIAEGIVAAVTIYAVFKVRNQPPPPPIVIPPSTIITPAEDRNATTNK